MSHCTTHDSRLQRGGCALDSCAGRGWNWNSPGSTVVGQFHEPGDGIIDIIEAEAGDDIVHPLGDLVIAEIADGTLVSVGKPAVELEIS